MCSPTNAGHSESRISSDSDGSCRKGVSFRSRRGIKGRRQASRSLGAVGGANLDRRQGCDDDGDEGWQGSLAQRQIMTRSVAEQLKSRQSGQARRCGQDEAPIVNRPDRIWYGGAWHRRIFPPAYKLPLGIEQAISVNPGGKRFYLKMTGFGKGTFAREVAEKGDYFTIYNGEGVDLHTGIRRSTTGPGEWTHLYSLEHTGYVRGSGLSAADGSLHKDWDLEFFLVQGSASMINSCQSRSPQHNVDMLVYPPRPTVRRV